MKHFVETTAKTVIGVVGLTLADFSGVAKTLTAGVGIGVAVASLVSLCFDIRRKWRHRND